MKIGLVCPYTMARDGGVQEVVRVLQSELTKRGHSAKIISFQPPSGQTVSDTSSMILVGAGTDVKALFHTTGQFSYSANTTQLDEILEREQFDILHFHEPWVPMLSRQLLVRSKAVNLATFHAKLPDTVMTKTIEKVITPYTKSILKYLDGYTAVSDAASEYISSLTDERIQIIPNGIDLTKYKSRDKQPDNKTILYIGRLEKRKGVKYLLKAYRQLIKTEPDARLIIVGDGPERPKLEASVQAWKLPKVEFLGFVSESKKLDLLHNAAVFCSPALFGESFGIVLLEAMARGVPVVAGNNPGYASVMKDTGEVSLVNPRRSKEFAARLQQFLNDEALQKEWLAWAQTYVKQFNYPKVVDMYETLYKQATK